MVAVAAAVAGGLAGGAGAAAASATRWLGLRRRAAVARMRRATGPPGTRLSNLTSARACMRYACASHIDGAHALRMALAGVN